MKMHFNPYSPKYHYNQNIVSTDALAPIGNLLDLEQTQCELSCEY